MLVEPSCSLESLVFGVGFTSFSSYRNTVTRGLNERGYEKSVFSAPTDQLVDRITWKRLKIDANILRGVLKALNFLSSHTPKMAIPRTAFPWAGPEPENWPNFSRQTGFPME